MKKLLILLSLICALFFLVGCATGVRVPYIQPAEVNMSSYRNIAIASCVPVRTVPRMPRYMRLVDFGSLHRIDFSSDWTSYTAERAADYVTSRVTNTLKNSDYFKNILSSSTTDSIMRGQNASETFRQMGYDAVIIPKIEYMDFDEYVKPYYRTKTVYNKTKNKNVTVKELMYEHDMSVGIRISLTVIDTKNDNIYTIQSFSKSRSDYERISENSRRFLSSPESLLRSCIDSMNNSILTTFVPVSRTQNIFLMSNKPKLDAAKIAYQAASDGNFAIAIDTFEKLWKEQHHIPSGYNAALLTAGLGKLDQSLAMIMEMRETVVNKDLEKLYQRVSAMKNANDKALQQLEDHSSSTVDTTVTSGMSVYDYILSR